MTKVDNYRINNRLPLKLKGFSKNSYFISSERTKGLLANFKGLNDSNKTILPVKKAISLLNDEITKYYNEKRGEENAETSKESMEEDVQSKWIEVPSIVYQALIQNNIKPAVGNRDIRGRNIRRIHENFPIITKLMLEKNESPQYVAKWLRMHPKLFYK